MYFNPPINTIDSAIDDVMITKNLVVEEGIVLGRVLTAMSANIADTTEPISAVNDSKGQYQYIWKGMYRVKLLRGPVLGEVFCSCHIGRGSQVHTVIPPGEVVCIAWMTKNGIKVPVILGGVSVEFLSKQMGITDINNIRANRYGVAALLDPGEHVIRAAISRDPETTDKPGYPFFDNQHDNPKTYPNPETGIFDEGNSKAINRPGGEIMLDKFGRILLTSRHKGHEFLITVGKTDSGQDDISSKATMADQDSYYAGISNDESLPVSADDVMLPKPLNLVQYEVIKSKIDLGNDNIDVVGYLPRFDKWKFQPIVVRKYADTTWAKESGTVYSVYQARSQSTASSGYCLTVTNAGDAKEYVGRHMNLRVKNDCLISVGGNYELRINPTMKDSESGYNCKLIVKSDGALTIDSKKGLTIEAVDGTYLKAGTATQNKMVRGDDLVRFLTSFYNMMAAWVPIPMDGGAALKAAYMAWFSANVPTVLNSVLSSKNTVN